MLLNILKNLEKVVMDIFYKLFQSFESINFKEIKYNIIPVFGKDFSFKQFFPVF